MARLGCGASVAFVWFGRTRLVSACIQHCRSAYGDIAGRPVATSATLLLCCFDKYAFYPGVCRRLYPGVCRRLYPGVCRWLYPGVCQWFTQAFACGFTRIDRPRTSMAVVLPAPIVPGRRWSVVALPASIVSGQRWSVVALPASIVSGQRWSVVALPALIVSGQRWSVVHTDTRLRVMVAAACIRVLLSVAILAL